MSGKITPWLQRGTRLFARLEDALLVGLLSAMILVAVAQILLRNFWDSGLAWGDPFTKVMVLWVGLLGAMVASRNDKHINIDLLSRFLSAKFKAASRALNALFTAAVCGVIAYHAARLVLIDKEADTSVFAGLPTWICELIIPIGFGVIALRYGSIALTELIRRESRPAP